MLGLMTKTQSEHTKVRMMSTGCFLKCSKGHPPDDWELLVKEAKAQSRKQNKDISRGNSY
jgi:hypothetical protein